jgi:acyl dehydratase
MAASPLVFAMVYHAVLDKRDKACSVAQVTMSGSAGMRQFANLDELKGAVGQVIGEGEWFTVTQTIIDKFADATGDFQYIHVDPERAKDGPFGTTVAHGFLTLSLLPTLGRSVYRVGGIATGINYGANRIRFIEPVKVDARIRSKVKLVAVEPHPPGERITTETTVEIEGSARPALVAEILSLMIRNQAA